MSARDRKNGASREAWMKSKKIGRLKQIFVVDEAVDRIPGDPLGGTKITGHFEKVPRGENDPS